MQTQNHFGRLTARMNEFREKLVNAKPYICAERAVYTTEAYKQFADKPLIEKRAYMLKNILEIQEKLQLNVLLLFQKILMKNINLI